MPEPIVLLPTTSSFYNYNSYASIRLLIIFGSIEACTLLKQYRAYNYAKIGIMKLCIFGASGKTGVEVAILASKAGHSITACDISKNPKLEGLKNLEFIELSVLDSNAVSEAMKGADAVISELGVKIGSSEPVLSEGNKNIVSNMQKLKIKRLITQSAFGAADSWQSLPFYYKLIHKTLLGPMSRDKDKMEKIVASSGLDYTIIRPIRLTSGPAKGHYRAGKSIKFGLDPHISRKDVARFIMDELKAKRYIRQAVTLTY